MKDAMEFDLGEVKVYIVENGIDLEFPDDDSPFSNAINILSLEKADTIKLAEAILEYYKDLEK